MTAFSGSYLAEDVRLLLRPMTLATTDVGEKERLIQSGKRHYSEMLSAEAAPDPTYMDLFRQAMARNGARLGGEIASLAEALRVRRPGRPVVLASLVRAGIPVGVLLRRALLRAGVEVHHYGISIIRDRGIDTAALDAIKARHDPSDIVFVDGWTGKGTIASELRRAQTPAETFLVVVADPAGKADLAASGDDFVIPSGLLNGVVSGLVSRSVLNAEVEAAGGFHGCVLLDHLAPYDVSRVFVDAIDGYSAAAKPTTLDWSAERRCALSNASAAVVLDVMDAAAVTDVNRVKPGIAEAARAMLRRAPHRLFLTDVDDLDLQPLAHLARAKGVAVARLPPGGPYKAVAVIRSLGLD